ncbi:MAG: Rab family GTPase [Anaerolineales bacterium]|jgi:small GTP-binding protein
MSVSRKQVLVVADEANLNRWLEQVNAQALPYDVHALSALRDSPEGLRGIPFDVVLLGPGSASWSSPETLRSLRAGTSKPRILSIGDGQPGACPGREGLVDQVLDRFPSPHELTSLICPSSDLEPAPTLTLKVLLGGEASVGKTTLLRYYLTGLFEPTREMTIGVDFHIYSVLFRGVNLRLVVWDIAGQNRFRSVRLSMYKGSSAAGLVFDLHNRTSFYQLAVWWREVRETLGDIPVLLLGNKSDLPRAVNRSEAEALASAWRIPYYEASCLDGSGVGEFFQALALTAAERAQKSSKWPDREGLPPADQGDRKQEPASAT